MTSSPGSARKSFVITSYSIHYTKLYEQAHAETFKKTEYGRYLARLIAERG